MGCVAGCVWTEDSSWSVLRIIVCFRAHRLASAEGSEREKVTCGGGCSEADWKRSCHRKAGG